MKSLTFSNFLGLQKPTRKEKFRLIELINDLAKKFKVSFDHSGGDLNDLIFIHFLAEKVELTFEKMEEFTIKNAVIYYQYGQEHYKLNAEELAFGTDSFDNIDLSIISNDFIVINSKEHSPRISRIKGS